MYSAIYTETKEREIRSYLHSVIQKASRRDVEDVLSKNYISFADFLVLISPAAEPFLEEMAQRARQVALSRFGKNIFLYCPLYISNECVNTCTYCGFSRPNKIRRRTLTLDEVFREGEVIRGSGIRNLLLLTGESPKRAPVSYIKDAVCVLRPLFDSIHLEVFPVTVDIYREYLEAGVDGISVYQETYNRDTYKTVHTGGFKMDFDYRLDCPDRVAAAGIRNISIGALFGLSPWREEAAVLAHHLRYLEKTAFRSAISLSFPRLKEAYGAESGSHPITDREFVQMVCAFRIFSPDVGINISTREPQWLRDGLISVGITAMSAGSRTDVGGYSMEPESDAQFSLDDTRSPREVAEAIASKGYQPVFKNWDAAFLPSAMRVGL
ncbi:MAG: 2-iminoacetate synthase ThiH [Candidatus Dadabacteria bacterium]|nr:MAG: 2-iminoacetate synthase ThiH [Candidatus Dadabacteria bacterium]